MSMGSQTMTTDRVRTMNQQYLKGVQQKSFPGGVTGFGDVAAQLNQIRVMGTPTVALAESLLWDAVKQIADLAKSQGQGRLAEQQMQILNDAIESAFSTLEQQSTDVGDKLQSAAVDRLSSHLGGR